MPTATAVEAPQGDERPDRLDYAERPRARQEPVEAGEGASDGEGEHESRVAGFKGVHDHHESQGCNPECREHGLSLPGEGWWGGIKDEASAMARAPMRCAPGDSTISL